MASHLRRRLRRAASALFTFKNGRSPAALYGLNGPYRVDRATTSSSALLLRRGVEELRRVEDAVHRRDEVDRDEPHDQTHEDDHRRFEQRREALQLVLELLAVILRGV